MARYTCPCCGKAYNGKKCKNCLYEPFGEEIHHGDHSHKGGVLVMEEPAPRPVPGKVPGTGAGKKKSFPEKQKKAPRILLWVLVGIFLLEPALILAGTVIGNVMERIPVSPEPVADVVLAKDAPVLYSDENFTIYGNWEGDPNFSLMLVAVENHTKRSVEVTAEQIVADGYLTERSFLHCNVPAGKRTVGRLYLDEEDMELAGIYRPGELSFQLEICDAKTYDPILRTDTMTFTGNLPGESAPDLVPEGIPMVQAEGITLSYLGYLPDTYEPETLTEGTFQFLVENTSDQVLSVYTINSWVNEKLVDITLWCRLPAHTRTVAKVYLYGIEKLGLRDIEELETLKLQLGIYDEDWEQGTELKPVAITLP